MWMACSISGYRSKNCRKSALLRPGPGKRPKQIDRSKSEPSHPAALSGFPYAETSSPGISGEKSRLRARTPSRLFSTAKAAASTSSKPRKGRQIPRQAFARKRYRFPARRKGYFRQGEHPVFQCDAMGSWLSLMPQMRISVSSQARTMEMVKKPGVPDESLACAAWSQSTIVQLCEAGQQHR